MDELVKRAQQGNKEAFTELILLLKADLYKIAKTRIKMMKIYMMQYKKQ